MSGNNLSQKYIFRFNIILLQIKQQWDWTKIYHNLCVIIILYLPINNTYIITNNNTHKKMYIIYIYNPHQNPCKLSFIMEENSA